MKLTWEEHVTYVCKDARDTSGSPSINKEKSEISNTVIVCVSNDK